MSNHLSILICKILLLGPLLSEAHLLDNFDGKLVPEDRYLYSLVTSFFICKSVAHMAVRPLVFLILSQVIGLFIMRYVLLL